MEVLDHGYLIKIEHWGSDERIIEAARMSTNKGFLGWEPGPCPACDSLNTAYVPHPEDGPCRSCDGKGRIRGDKLLLKYLYENWHRTPFEMAGMTIEVKAPIFVFREWHRHRTQCLAADTPITLVNPRGEVYKRTIERLFIQKHGRPLSDFPGRHSNGTTKSGNPATRRARRKYGERVGVRPECQIRTLRTFDEVSGQFRTGIMRDVWESGGKEIWVLETDRSKIKASANHPFLTRSGWAYLQDLRPGEEIATSGIISLQERLIPPSLRSGIGVWTSMMRKRLIRDSDKCYRCGDELEFNGLELDHVVPVIENLKLALDENNLRPVCVPCHKLKSALEQTPIAGRTGLGLVWTKVVRKPFRVSEEMTYDIEMLGPDHNYVASDLVVHNSYNEMSARYVPLPNDNYLPTVERCLVVNTKNKQAGSVAGVVSHDQALMWLECLDALYVHSQKVYELGLEAGIPKELARLATTVGRYSKMRASANLRNILAFLTLRQDSDTQEETRRYANAWASLVKDTFPRTFELYAKEAGIE